MPKVSFRFGDGKEISVNARIGDTIMDIARHAGVAIDAPCAGNGTCGKCRVQVVEGSALAERTRHITDEDWDKGWRLACETTVEGEVTVAVPDTASAFKTGIRTADLNDPATFAAFENIRTQLHAAGVMEQDAIQVVSLQLSEPTLDDTMPDNERLVWAVEAEGYSNVRLSFEALCKLSAVLREHDFAVRCVLACYEEQTVILDVLPGDDEAPVCGVAIDIGTTTVTGVLTDMCSGRLLGRASAGNGQIRYGADVINRIIHSVKPGGARRLQKAVVEETLVPLLDSLCHQAGVSRERIYRLSIAGNTTMEHLLLGVYADPIRMEPFIPTFFESGTLRAGDLIPGLNSAAPLVLAPNVGSYVGGDITAGVLATGLWNSEELSLFIDLGTNGELVLGNSDYMFTCACSAGPAFEGGDISCGMRATVGAIEAVTIDKETQEPTLTVVGDTAEQKPIGLCGSGIIDTVASLFRAGIIDARGKFVGESKRVLRDEFGMGRYVLADESESADGREISINEVDLDNFIRAKGAIFSAIRLMLANLGMDPEAVEKIMIAGGIGSGIDIDNAVYIGMLPDVDREKFSYIGNSSLTGAYAMLMARDAEGKVNDIGRNMTYVELSNEPTYMDEFVSACFLPHTDSRLFPSVEV